MDLKRNVGSDSNLSPKSKRFGKWAHISPPVCQLFSHNIGNLESNTRENFYTNMNFIVYTIWPPFLSFLFVKDKTI